MQTECKQGRPWSGFTLFAQAYLSKNLESLRYLLGNVPAHIPRLSVFAHHWWHLVEPHGSCPCHSNFVKPPPHHHSHPNIPLLQQILGGLGALPEHFQNLIIYIYWRDYTYTSFTTKIEFHIIWATSWENLFMPYANNKGADQPVHPHSLVSAFFIHCMDGIIPLLAIAKISRPQLVCICTVWSAPLLFTAWIV